MPSISRRRQNKLSSQGTVADGVARDGTAAWEQLLKSGNLEPDRRDAGFVDELRVRLSPSSVTLAEALRGASTDDLVHAFFELMQPFVSMFRAILDFFEAAGAREGGKQQWEIHIEREHLNLRHFQQFLEHWRSLKHDQDIPAIDLSGAWAVDHAGHGITVLGNARTFLEGPGRATTGLPDVDAWLEDYRIGRYGPFPLSLQPARLSAELADAAGVLLAIVGLIRRRWSDRDAMQQERVARGVGVNYADGLSPETIAHYEHDYLLGSSVVILARYGSLNEADRSKFATDLAERFSRYPRRLIGVTAELPDLERILRLPLWRGRNELYAVWVATEILRALRTYDCELHSENGRIVFAFKETVVATVHGTQPRIRLYSERKTPLSNPIPGHGRTGNVQPDYGLWRGEGPGERCCLVVEVKHYLKDDPGRFRDVLIDYASAHPYARVALVNHGRANNVADLPAELARRCNVIGLLTVSNLKACEQFQDLVRTCVGPSRREVILAIDISGSMAEAVRALARSDDLRMLAESRQARVVVLADTEVRETYSIAEAATALRRISCHGSTGLAGPLTELLRRHEKVLLITDTDGVRDLGRKPVRVEQRKIGSAKVEIVELDADGSEA